MTTIYERKKNGNEKNLSLWVSPNVSSCIVLTAEEEKNSTATTIIGIKYLFL